MGAIIGLKGPSSTAKVANASRSRDRETKGRREYDTRKVQAEHDFCFADHDDYQVVSRLCCDDSLCPQRDLAISFRAYFYLGLDAHGRLTFTLAGGLDGIASHFGLPRTWRLQLEAYQPIIADCGQVDRAEDQDSVDLRTRGLTFNQLSLIDAEPGLKDLSKVVMVKAFIPLIHAMLTARMSRAQRFPPAGEEDEEIAPEPIPRHLRENAVALPTQQMIDYKKKLKAAGRKPEKQKRAAPEQHFDDCGENLQSIWKVSLVPESYHDSYLTLSR